MSSTVSSGQKEGEMIKVSRDAIGLVRTKTESGIPVKEVYQPEDIATLDYARDIGNPGEYPILGGYTLGCTADSYGCGRLPSAMEPPRKQTGRLRNMLPLGLLDLVSFAIPLP